MALEIKAIPTLYGEAAERFLKLAEATPEERSKRKKIKIDRDLVDKVLRKAKMVQTKIMSWLFDNCTMIELSEKVISQGVSFSCGNHSTRHV